VVARKSDTRGGLNDRFGSSLKADRKSRVRRDMRYVVAALLLIAAIGVAVFVIVARFT